MITSVDLSIDQVCEYFEGMAEAVEKVDLTPVFEEIALMFSEATRECFDNSRDPWGNPWAPLKTPQFNKLPFSGKLVERRPLVKTGNLMRHASDKVAIGPRTLEIGSGVPYSIFHQEGTRRMVARPFLGWSEWMLNRAGEMVAKYLVEAMVMKAGQEGGMIQSGPKEGWSVRKSDFWG
jgi:phage gpG-like protein